MATSFLLSRLTLALSTVSALGGGVVSCGGETSEGGSAGASVGGAGGTGPAAGSGGSGSTAGKGGSRPTAGNGGATSCERALPATERSCHTTADCTKSGGFGTCYAPGDSSCDGLGGPSEPTCESDASCTASGFPTGYLCQPNDGAKKYCRPPCTDNGSCGTSVRCDVGTGRCEPRPCDDAAACLAGAYCTAAKVCAVQMCNVGNPCAEGFSCTTSDFTCVPTPCAVGSTTDCPSSFGCNATTLQCARLPCACDTDCGGGGYCVGGSCYPIAGHCDGGCAIGRPLLTRLGVALVARLTRGSGGSAWSA